MGGGAALRFASMDDDELVRILSYVGDAPPLFAPDTGEDPTAVLSGPSGKHKLSIAQRSPRFGGRIGYDLPEFTEPGDYKLTIGTGDAKLVYHLTVVDRAAEPFAGNFGKRGFVSANDFAEAVKARAERGA